MKTVTNINDLNNKTEQANFSEHILTDWSALAKGSNIENLDLSYTNLTDQDTAVISQLTCLKTLDLSGTEVSDLSFLKNLRNLEELRLNQTDVKSLSAVAHLPHLRILSANETGIESLEPLHNATNLQKLSLENTEINNLSPLKNAKKLKKLDLYGCSQIKSLADLARLPQLEDINLQNTGIRDNRQFQHLEQLKNLRQLTLDDEFLGIQQHILSQVVTQKTPSKFFEAPTPSSTIAIQEKPISQALEEVIIIHSDDLEAGIKRIFNPYLDLENAGISVTDALQQLFNVLTKKQKREEDTPKPCT